MSDFVAIDFETANLDKRSPCSIGVAIVKDNKITGAFERLIKPHKDYSKFDSQCYAKHKINPDMVADKPEFNTVMQEIFPVLDNSLVVAHNMPFDGNVLTMTSDLYGLKYPVSKTVCTLGIAHSLWGVGGCSLAEICRRFTIPFNGHHQAANDAVVCAKIFLVFLEMEKEVVNSHIYSSWPKSKEVNEITHKVPFYKQILGTADLELPISWAEKASESLPLKGLNIALTGEMCIPRELAIKAVKVAGGIIKTTVTKNTDFLVYGNKQDTSLFVDGQKSHKTRAAEMLIENGYPIKIISEEDFLNMIGWA